MEYLQYRIWNSKTGNLQGFKPYYKWNTFNTMSTHMVTKHAHIVLNLIINGIPSILRVNNSACNQYGF